jgi:hypothetical protein
MHSIAIDSLKGYYPRQLRLLLAAGRKSRFPFLLHAGPAYSLSLRWLAQLSEPNLAK